MNDNYKKAQRAFGTFKGKHRLFVFYNLDTFPVSQEAVDLCMDSCVEHGVSCIIPRLPVDTRPSPTLIPHVADMYVKFARASRRTGVHVCFHIRDLLEKSYYLMENGQKQVSSLTHVLIRHEYFCDPGEQLHLKLTDDHLMSVVAYDEEHRDIIDLREFVTPDGYLDYTVPQGNWTIEQYICTTEFAEDTPAYHTCNRLSFEHCTAFLDSLLETLGEKVSSEFGKTITSLYAPGLCFHAPNRRNWDPSFNQVFEGRYGFDPAPFYPALYHHIGEKDAHIKALFMDCRAAMFRQGILSAIKAFCDRRGMRTFYSVAEPKLAACSWLNGDALADGLFSPCAVQEKAYLYGMNSTHLAASAADNFGSKYVPCELFRDYVKLAPVSMRKDVLNAYGHGANLLMAHASGDLQDLGYNPHKTFFSRRRAFPAFVARVQSLLRGGSRVNDIAMLYPIYALHDKVYLYEDPVGDHFEYPDTPTSCNYMTVLDTLSTYAGQDVTILHPTVVNSACSTANGILYLKNIFQTQAFRVLILPAADMVSVQNLRLVKDFYDGGGKVIAVGELPSMAFEYRLDQVPNAENFYTESEGTPEDREVREIIRHIFGKDAINRDVVNDYFYHHNDNGGEAYYIGSAFTAADGTEAADCASLNDALQAFHVPLDVYMPDMPRFDCRGALNNPYTEFARLGLVDHIPGGGMISHIHKQRDNLDIYFFANSTDLAYNEKIYLRGIHSPQRWDPHTGKINRLHHHYVRYHGEIYTAVQLYLPSNHAVFLISPMRASDQRIRAHAASLPDMTNHINMMEQSNISWSNR